MNKTLQALTMTALLMCGCSNDGSHADFPENSPEAFMCVMHINLCDDGMYELKTDISEHGRFPSLEMAREAKTNWANQASQYWLAHPLEVETKTAPDCGKRIE